MVEGGPSAHHAVHELDLLPHSPQPLLDRQEARRRRRRARPHLGVDPTLVRVGFAVSILFSGAGLLAYLVILAIVPSDDAMPAATSPTAA